MMFDDSQIERAIDTQRGGSLLWRDEAQGIYVWLEHTGDVREWRIVAEQKSKDCALYLRDGMKGWMWQHPRASDDWHDIPADIPDDAHATDEDNELAAIRFGGRKAVELLAAG